MPVPAKPFPKGNKLAKGGARPGAGRKSKAEVEAREAFIKAFEEEANRRKIRLVNSYFNTAEIDPTTIRHFVDKYVPNAKQEIEHSGHMTHTYEVLETNVDLSKV